jgi:soluble lytic murein transglycosylase
MEIELHPTADYAFVPNTQTIIERYPDTATALQAVEQNPSVIATLIDPYQIGLVYYYAGEDEKARLLLQQAIDGQGSNAAAASFYLGALDERDGLPSSAISQYGRVATLDAHSSLADDALWWQGRLREQDGRAGEAAGAYEKLAADYRSSSFADEARFRLALLAYDGGRDGDAAAAFGAIAEAGGGLVRQRALLWQGKALAAAGDEEGADAVWQALREEAPADYYGLRAALLLGETRGKLKSGGIDAAQTPDWTAIEAWLRDAKGGEGLLARQTLFGNPHWSQGNALLSAGMTKQANAEFALLLERGSGDAATLLELARYMGSAGMFDLSSRAAARLLNQVSPAAAAAAPADLWRLAYPAPFAGALRGASDEEDVPEVLLLALVRQESFFDPLAGSSAGAAGLTQVVPATGEAIAGDLKLGQFQPGDLFLPSLSLRFGAHYLREQLVAFDDDLYAALAAYNAGPGNALRWQRAAGDDVDRFVAEIDYTQTETYVRLVMENLARYRQLYQDVAEPALPSG